MLDFVPRENNDFRGSLVSSDIIQDNVHNQDAHGRYDYACIHSPQASNFEHTIHSFMSGSGFFFFFKYVFKVLRAMPYGRPYMREVVYVWVDWK